MKLLSLEAYADTLEKNIWYRTRPAISRWDETRTNKTTDSRFMTKVLLRGQTVQTRRWTTAVTLHA